MDVLCEVCNTKNADLKVAVADMGGDVISTVYICKDCSANFKLTVEDLTHL